MHIIESVVIAEAGGRSRDGQTHLPLSTFTWNKTFIESCQADNLRQLDLDTYFSLEERHLQAPLPLPRQAVLPARRVDVRPRRDRLRPRGPEPQLRGQRRQDQGKASTGHRRAGGHRLPPPAQPRRPLQPHRPWGMDDPPHPTIPCPCRPAATTPPRWRSRTPPLAAELASRGVSPAAARTLVQKHDAEAIRLQIEILDWRLAGKKADKIDDPAAWLVAAIKHPHTPPKGFISKAERQRAKKPSRPSSAQRPKPNARNARKKPASTPRRKPSTPIGNH